MRSAPFCLVTPPIRRTFPSVAICGRASKTPRRSPENCAPDLARQRRSPHSRPRAARKPKALQRASAASLTWFEQVRRYAEKPFEQFVFSLLTNSMRITYARVEKAAPDLVRAVDAQIAGPSHGSNRPPPPMFAPYRLRELEFANRIVVSPMCMYSAKDGTVNDFHLVHLGSRAIGGAGLVIT